jgi:Xaa-Pro aminopeptidase
LYTKGEKIMRLTLFRQQMQRQQAEAVLVTDAVNVRYLSGFTGSAGQLLITAEQAILITDYRYIEQAQSQVTEFQCYCRDRSRQSLGQAIVSLLTEKPAQLQLDYDQVSVDLYQQLQQELPYALADSAQITEKLRAIKDPDELASIRQAASIADQALSWLLPQLKPGVSEQQAAQWLDAKILELGAEALAFPTILLSGPRTALPHGKPSERCFQAGDLILIDFGAQVRGYKSDMTRSYILGQASTEQRQFYQTVAAAQNAALAAAKAGIRVDQLTQVAHKVLADSVFAAYAGEGLGHSIGLALHEQPLMRYGNDQVLQSGMVVTIEPGLYWPGFGGVRLEDDILITPDGAELLTHSPKPMELPLS